MESSSAVSGARKSKLANGFLILFGAAMMLLGGTYLSWRLNHLGIVTPPDWALFAGLILGGAALVVIGLQPNPRIKNAALYAIYLGISVEVFLQIAAHFGLIPGLNYFFHSPYSFVYQTEECFNQSRMNRYGLHYPEFGENGKEPTVVLIGDSFIQALQVAPKENVGVALERLINEGRKESAQPVRVISLGIGGFGPGGYLELLKYAQRHFKPERAIIFFCLCNDFSDSSIELQKGRASYDPLLGIYYSLDSSGEPTPTRLSEAAVKRLHARLESNHRSLAFHAPGIIRNNLISLLMLKEAYDIVRARRTAGDAPPGDVTPTGCDDFMFLTDRPPEAQDAFRLAVALLEKCHEYAERHGISLAVVTIPIFPRVFLESEDWDNWGLEEGVYDFLAPERDLVLWGAEHDVPALPMGRVIRESGMDFERLKGLFCLSGDLHWGHWSVNGHRYWARKTYDAFFAGW